MAIHRVTARWTGFIGAPGYTALHFMAGGGLISDAQSSVDRARNALLNLEAILPTDVRIVMEPEVQEIDESTGVITDFINVEPGVSIGGGAVGIYSAVSGGVVNWRTNDLRFGRRIRGRTFIVPLASNTYDADGTLTASALNALNAFGDDLVGGDLDSEFVVWSRPRDGSGGVAATVVQHSVPDMAAVLRSRRD